MNAFRSPLAFASIEPLEFRIAPAVLSLSGSVLTYTAGSGVANDVTVSYNLFADEYLIQDQAETIVLNPAAEAAGFSVSANGHKAVGPALTLAHYLSLLTLELGDQNDEVSIIASATPINIQGGAGEDHFHIGSSSVLFIEEDITVNGGGGARNSLEINDPQTRPAGIYTVTGSAISRTSGPVIDFSINFSGVSDVSLQGGVGPNTFRIEALNAGQSLEVQGSEGFDTFLVGAGNSLAPIAGELSIITNGGNDRLVFNDQNRVGSNPAVLTSTTFSPWSGPPINYEAQAGDVVTLNLQPRFFSPTAPLLVSGLARGVEYFLSARDITLGSAGAGSLDALLGHVTTSASFLTIDDSAASTPHYYVIDASTLTRDGIELVQFDYLEGGMLSTGSGDDFIKAKESTTRFNFNTGGGDDRIVAPQLGTVLDTGPGIDTLTITRIPGDVTIDASGVSVREFGYGLTFSGGAPEFIKIAGDNGPNTIDAEAFPGFAILDGGGGGDTLIGGDANLFGKSATFTDPDGDLVTIQNDVARFGVGNVDFIPSGLGGALSRLDLSLSDGTKSFAQANLTITATRGAFRGDGRTAVGQILANGFDLASVVVDGDLAAIQVGDYQLGDRALGLLHVNSLGLYGTAYLPDGASADSYLIGKTVRVEVTTDFASGSLNVSAGGAHPGRLGSLVVGGDFAGMLSTTGRIGSIDLGNMVEGGLIFAERGANIVALTIRHGMRLAQIYADGTIGSLEIGGNVSSSAIIARGGYETPVNDDAALVLRSLRIGGSVTDTLIGAGLELNPDVAIGSVFIAGNFIRSDLVAGIDSSDGVFGNGDDKIATSYSGAFANVTGGDPAITARIASVIIGGGVFGAPLFPTTHPHAITAQQIDRLKIGGEPVTLTDNLDNLPLSLSGDIRVVEIG